MSLEQMALVFLGVCAGVALLALVFSWLLGPSVDVSNSRPVGGNFVVPPARKPTTQEMLAYNKAVTDSRNRTKDADIARLTAERDAAAMLGKELQQELDDLRTRMTGRNR